MLLNLVLQIYSIKYNFPLCPPPSHSIHLFIRKPNPYTNADRFATLLRTTTKSVFVKTFIRINTHAERKKRGKNKKEVIVYF